MDSQLNWPRLQEIAADEVRRTIRRLPPDLRKAASALPVSYERMPSPALLEEGLDADTLGLFVGGEHSEENQSLLPSQIILFLENIWLMVEEEEGNEADFRKEVRITYLHELGHYLGLDEDELIDRGLE